MPNKDNMSEFFARTGLNAQIKPLSDTGIEVRFDIPDSHSAADMYKISKALQSRYEDEFGLHTTPVVENQSIIRMQFSRSAEPYVRDITEGLITCYGNPAHLAP